MKNIHISGNKGSNVIISNGIITVNGKRIDLDENEKYFTLEISGDVEKLEVDVCEKITIAGRAGTIKSTNGNVICGDVEGNVTTVNGNVRAKKINGDVDTVNGDIENAD